ncbi:putative zinc finger CCCH-type containing 15 [Apostichopus japonicus]|uniref:Putative zinc finger CCCH-type containing 15 n=1 Tax=Stichopus japonicus TaxID=307972 RepID=A0A2G8LH47_STIJA|nr:putative zinc finger CCCH-type containing 15 [Apostichopus japonicus]
MPPKKGQKANKKTEQKVKEKLIEDKTFGLKNKKGAKQQTFIKSVQHQVKYGNQKATKVDDAQDKKKGRELKKKEQDELNLLFRPVAGQKVAKGVDPKSVVCAFFKQGTCRKGDKCKFSHDLTLERKSEKRSIYEEGGQEKDTMEDWDEAKLKEVVEQKHAEADKKIPKTNIVCKHFVKAIEESKYGWFWNCPSGEKCIYKHTLPPGFVLKKKKPTEQPEEEKISLEELIEEERAKLGPNQTKITLETFRDWKQRKIEEKKRKLEQDQTKKKNDFKEGKALGITGREVFQFNPDMILADDDEADEGVMEMEEGETRERSKVIWGHQGSNFENLVNTIFQEGNHGQTSYLVCRSTALFKEAYCFWWRAKVIWGHQESNRVDLREGSNCRGPRVSGHGGYRHGHGFDEPVERGRHFVKRNSTNRGNSIDPSVEDEADRLGAAAPIPSQGPTDGIEGAMVNGTETIDLDVEVDEELFDEDLDNLDEELDQIDLD